MLEARDFSSIEIPKAQKRIFFFNLSSAAIVYHLIPCACDNIDVNGVKKPFSIPIAPSTSAQNSSANRLRLSAWEQNAIGEIFFERKSALKNAIHKKFFPPQSILIYEYWVRINVIFRSQWRENWKVCSPSAQLRLFYSCQSLQFPIHHLQFLLHSFPFFYCIEWNKNILLVNLKLEEHDIAIYWMIVKPHGETNVVLHLFQHRVQHAAMLHSHDCHFITLFRNIHNTRCWNSFWAQNCCF